MELAMKTGCGVEISGLDLTHQFVWCCKTCPIGQFDPSDYPKKSLGTWANFIQLHQQEIFDQLEDSGVFSDMTVLAREGVVWNHVRSDDPGGPHHQREPGMLVVFDQDGGDAEPVTQKEL